MDTGTAGWQEIAHFKESVIDRSKCRILAYVNIKFTHQYVLHSLNGMGEK